MLAQFYRRTKSALARAIARIFYCLVDSQLESELVASEEFIRVQTQRRMDIERHLAKYLGPRPF